MFKFLRLPKKVTASTTQDELVDQFFGYAYFLAAEDPDFTDRKETMLQQLEDVPYEPHIWWKALWLAGMASMIRDPSSNSIRNQILQEIQDVEDMSDEEFCYLYQLFFSSIELMFDGNLFYMAPRIVAQLDPNSFYFPVSPQDNARINVFVKKYGDSIRPVSNVLSSNKYLNLSVFVRDIVEAVVSSPNYYADCYCDFLVKVFKTRSGWTDHCTEEQHRIVKELGAIIKGAAETRAKKESEEFDPQ